MAIEIKDFKPYLKNTLYEFAFKRLLRWLRRRLLDVRWVYACVACFSPPCNHLECKSVLQDFVTLRLTNIGLEICDACLHLKNDSRWIQLPARKVSSQVGDRWVYLLDFYDKALSDQFRKTTINALDKFLAEGKGIASGF